MNAKRDIITGSAIVVRGNDIDTDRIIPARFLKTVVFEGLGDHAFEDDRTQAKAEGIFHPFDDPKFANAEILLVNKNFGCGSSREHAPQAIMRFGKGIRAIVGESFAEIFFGNCVALGIPCVTVDEPSIAALMKYAEENPSDTINVRLTDRTIQMGTHTTSFTIAEGARKQFIAGTWDSTLELLANKGAIETTASALPYFNHWK